MVHLSGGTSLKNGLHFAQGVLNDGFRRFDYGAEQNLILYGQEAPPDYDLSRTTFPVHIFHGANDWLATVEVSTNDRIRLCNHEERGCCQPRVSGLLGCDVVG